MDKDNYIRKAVCYLFLMALIVRNRAAVVNVKTKGAKGDGVTDDGPVHVNDIYTQHLGFMCFLFTFFSNDILIFVNFN